MNYLQKIASRVKNQLPPDAIPDGVSEPLFLTYAVLLLAKGESVTRADVHNAWVAWMTQIDPSHESIRPFGKLPDFVQDEDDVYVRAIRTAASMTNEASG
jgi:hypothetical protein